MLMKRGTAPIGFTITSMAVKILMHSVSVGICHDHFQRKGNSSNIFSMGAEGLSCSPRFLEKPAHRVQGRFHVDIDNGSNVESQQLRDQQPRRQPRGRGGAGAPRHRRRVLEAIGRVPIRAAIRGHHYGPETQDAAFIDGLSGSSAQFRLCACSAKSIIMIAFFLTIPMSMMIPTTSINAQGGVEDEQGYPARRLQRQGVLREWSVDG